MYARLGILVTTITLLMTIGINAQDKNIQSISDSDLLEKLTSDKKETANEAVAEVFRRGEKIMPTLLAVKGDKRLFYGVLVKNPSFSMEIRSPSDDSEVNARWLKEGKLVTVEVAAVYLIVAIYYDSLSISQSPYLTNDSLPPAKRRAANTEDVVSKAWEAIDVWSEKFKTLGLEKLRASKDAPLAQASVSFW